MQYAAPVTYAAPASAVTYAAPASSVSMAPAATTYAAPAATTYAAPVATYAAPPVYGATTYAAPATTTYAAPATTTYAAPAATTYAAPPVYAAAYGATSFVAPATMTAPPVYVQQQQPMMMQQQPMMMQQQPMMMQQQPMMMQQQPMIMQQQPMMVQQQMPQQMTVQQQSRPGGQKGARTHPSNTPLQEGGDIPVTGTVHMILCAIDYSCCPPPWGPPHALDTKPALDFMCQLADNCGIQSKMILYNQQVTTQGIANALMQMGQQCRPGDTLVFYYTGHGDSLADNDGDEASGKDQALCTLGPDGNAEPRAQVWTRDDVLVQMMSTYVPKHTKLLVLADCCHSGTIMDLDKPVWQGHEVICISGCTDTQTSAGTGHGGQFSRAMTCTICDLQREGKNAYGVARMYNKTLENYQKHKTPSHTQNITINMVGVEPHEFAWPLIPKSQYTAPDYAQRSAGVGPQHYVPNFKQSLKQQHRAQKAGGMPGMMPGAMPGMMPGAMPGAMPGMMPGAMPGMMPGAMPMYR